MIGITIWTPRRPAAIICHLFNGMSSSLEKIRTLNRQAWDLSKKDGPQALALAENVQNLLHHCADAQPRDEFECLRTKAYCLDMLSRPEEALPLGLRANLLAEKIGDNYLLGTIQSLLGRIYWHIDEYPTALSYYLGALKLVQTEPHPDLEISLINGLGMVHYSLKNYNESLASFKTCLEKSGKANPTGAADANNNIAYVLHLLGRNQEAVEYAQTALDLFSALGSYVGKLHTLHSLGAIHSALGNYAEAMAVLEEGLELARKNNSQLLIITYVIEISRIQVRGGELAAAEENLLEVLQIAETIKSLTNISLIHEGLIEIYKERQDFRSALEHFEVLYTLHQKIFNEESDRRMKTLEVLNQVENARRQAKLYQEMAETDSLTGLVNRRHFREIAENAVRQENSGKGLPALLMLDIDHFKEINDRHGHKAGDEVLKGVAKAITNSLRQGDLAGRYGGEEFVILVRDAPVGQHFKIAERIRQAVARDAIQSGDAAVSVSVSIGLVSVSPDRMWSLDELIEAADRAMYRAKEQGRSRVVVWE